MATRRQTSFAREHNIPLSRAKTILAAAESAGRTGGTVNGRALRQAAEGFNAAADHLTSIYLTSASSAPQWVTAGAAQLTNAADFLSATVHPYRAQNLPQKRKRATAGGASTRTEPANSGDTSTPLAETVSDTEQEAIARAATRAAGALSHIAADNAFTTYSGALFVGLATALVEWLDRAASDTHRRIEVRDPNPPRITPDTTAAADEPEPEDVVDEPAWIRQWAAELHEDHRIPAEVEAGALPVAANLLLPEPSAGMPRVVFLVGAPGRGQLPFAEHYARLVAHLEGGSAEVTVLRRHDLVGQYIGQTEDLTRHELTTATSRGVAVIDWDALLSTTGVDQFGADAARAIAHFADTNPDANLLIATTRPQTAGAYRLHPHLTLTFEPLTGPALAIEVLAEATAAAYPLSDNAAAGIAELTDHLCTLRGPDPDVDLVDLDFARRWLRAAVGSYAARRLHVAAGNPAAEPDDRPHLELEDFQEALTNLGLPIPAPRGKTGEGR